MKHATSRALYEYWTRIRGEDRAPLRSAIEPSDIRKILADTFITEVGGPRQFDFRLAGTRICALYGHEVKGTNLLDLWKQEEDRSAVATLAGAVADDGAVALMTVEARTASGSETVCELLLLPLRHGPRRFDRILGSLTPLERPYWLGSEPVTSQRIASLRLIWPDETPSFTRRRSDTPGEIRAAAAPNKAPARSGRQRGHLYVMDGGKE